MKAAIVAIGVAAWISLGACLSPWATAAVHPRGLYWGAEIGSQMTGEAAPWDMRPVERFEGIAGKGLSLIAFSAPFTECDRSRCDFLKFPLTPMENVRRYGALPLFGWTSSTTGGGLNEPAFRLSALIHGRYDAYIRQFALEAREWGHPFFLRFDWEMNGNWFPWGEGVNGNKPGEFVAAWRHVHDLFTRVGARNVTWVWCPNIDLEGKLTPLRSLYPGDRYVDWTGIDGFNWGIRRGSPGWLSFEQVFSRTYRQIVGKVAPRKPLMLAEVSTSSRGGNKAAWIRQMFSVMPTRFPKIRAFSWFDRNDRGSKWPIESSSPGPPSVATRDSPRLLPRQRLRVSPRRVHRTAPGKTLKFRAAIESSHRAQTPPRPYPRFPHSQTPRDPERAAAPDAV
jgi:hypothetical protein